MFTDAQNGKRTFPIAERFIFNVIPKILFTCLNSPILARNNRLRHLCVRNLFKIWPFLLPSLEVFISKHCNKRTL